MIIQHAVVEVLENLAFLANASNLVLYLTQYMHLSPSESANSVTNFMGTAFLLALLGGFLSDAFLTSYQIYLISALIEFLVTNSSLLIFYYIFYNLQLFMLIVFINYIYPINNAVGLSKLVEGFIYF